MRKPIIIAHRGASTHEQENTLESFAKAIELGADMIEFDVRRTKDEVFVAYHDALIDTNPIGRLTYKEIEKKHRSKGGHVPTIEEIVDLAKGRIGIDVEIKEEGYENLIVERIAASFGQDHLMVTSFNDASLRIVKRHFPDIPAGLILGKSKPQGYAATRLSELFPMKRCQRAQADFLVPNFRLLKFAFLTRARRRNIPVYVWTVNEKSMIEKLLRDKRVEGIITDRPDIAVAVRRGFALDIHRRVLD
jgi:glycerophosphoryl diester phosphodiesterase